MGIYIHKLTLDKSLITESEERSSRSSSRARTRLELTRARLRIAFRPGTFQGPENSVAANLASCTDVVDFRVQSVVSESTLHQLICNTSEIQPILYLTFYFGHNLLYFFYLGINTRYRDRYSQ